MALPPRDPRKHLPEAVRGHIHGLAALGWSRHKISKQLGYPRSTIRNVLAGSIKMPRRENPPRRPPKQQSKSRDHVSEGAVSKTGTGHGAGASKQHQQRSAG